MLPLYLNVFLPKTELLSSYAYFIFFACIILIYIKYKNIPLSIWKCYLFYLFLSLLIILLSSLVNINYVDYVDLSEIFRITFISLAFLYGVSRCDEINDNKITVFIFVFIMSQIIISIPQALNITSIVNFTSLIWSVDKITAGRVVGTMSNPNFLGILSSSLSVYIIVKMTINKKINYLDIVQIMFLFLIIIFAGSRTSLLSFTLCSFIVLSYNMRRHLFKFIVPAFVFILFSGDIYNFILEQESLRYIAEPLRLYEKNKTIDIMQVNALSHRIDIWASINQIFINDPSIFKYFLGVGPGKTIGLTFLDNQYLFWFFKYGIIGVIIFILLPMIALFISLSTIKKYPLVPNHSECLCFSFILVFIVNGFFAETFSSMMVAPLFYFSFGLVFGRFYNQKNDFPSKGFV